MRWYRGICFFLAASVSTPCAAGAERLHGGIRYMEPYVVEGLALGARVDANSPQYRKYRCQQSDQYVSSIWCQYSETKGGISTSRTILHLVDNSITYVNKQLSPAYFTPQEVDKEIARLSRQFGSSPHIYRSHVPGLPGGVIVFWGGIELHPLPPSDLALLAAGNSPHKGVLVDYLVNLYESGRVGLPVYSLSGTSGYVWIARFDETGKQRLRFFAADPSQMQHTGELSEGDDETIRIAIARAEAERARAEAEKAAAEKARAEADKAQAEFAKVRAESEMASAKSKAEEAHSGAEQPPSSAAQQVGENSVTPANAQAVRKRIADLETEINVLSRVVSEQQEIKRAWPVDKYATIDATIYAINSRVEALKKEHSEKEKNFDAYLTSIRPNDRNLYLTARKASEVYPKIPYYIPGTSETGEFWVEPTVSDKGEMRFSFKFIDPNSPAEKVRSKIDMTVAEMEDAQKALFKLNEWSQIAHQQKLRRNYEKRVTCFPVSECPPDGEQREGKSSTEIRFNVYEDGSTAGRIQRNKGLFVEGYNVSIDSALMLQAYLNHVINEAKLEYKSGTQRKKDLDKIFQ